MTKHFIGLGAILATCAATTSALADDTTMAPATTPTTTATTVAPTAPVSTTTVTQASVSDPTAPPAMSASSDVIKTESRLPNRALLFTGSLIGLATYVPTAVFGATSERQEDKYLFIPVAGPWIDLANRDYNARGSENKTLDTALLIGTGALQGAAAISVLSSFFIPETRKTFTGASSKPTFAVAPTQVGNRGAGIGAVGTF